MLHYEFPIINNLDDVKEVLKKKEFNLIQKDGYQVVNYMFQDQNTFETPLEAECRGLIFDTEGNVLSRRYHKFFNLGEKVSVPDLSKPHVILEKLDGSMVSPILLNGKVRWTTKMGITDVALPVEVFYENHPEYKEFVKLAFETGCTPIFEWCSPKQRIVVNYKTDQLILTAVRFNWSGKYMSYKAMQQVAFTYGIPVVKAYDVPDSSSINIIKDIVKSSESDEGVVIRFDDGHMIKIKSEWYLNLHKAKDDIRNERKVLRLFLDGKLDDLLPNLPPEDRYRVEMYQNNVVQGMLSFTESIFSKFQLLRASSMNKKEFAEKVVGQPYSPILFKLWDGDSDVKAVADYVERKANKPDEIRYILGCTYQDINLGDE